MDNKDTSDGGVGDGAGAPDGNKRTALTPSSSDRAQKHQQQKRLQQMEQLLQLKQQLQLQQLQQLTQPQQEQYQLQQQHQHQQLQLKQQLLRQQQVEEFLQQHQFQRHRQQFQPPQTPHQQHLQRLQSQLQEAPAQTADLHLQQLLQFQAQQRVENPRHGQLLPLHQHQQQQQQQQQRSKFSAEVEAAGKTASAVAFNSAALSSKLQHQFAQQQHHHQQQQQQQQQQPLLLLSSSSSSSSSSPTCVKDTMTSTAETLANAEARYNSHKTAANSAAMIAELINAEAADRSDSGLGSSRTLNSGDERSGSHSSAFSGSADEMHAAVSSPLNDQHAAPPSAFNAVWRDPSMIQSMDGGPIRHVESVQHQSLFMSNAMQMPQVVPCQTLHPPSPSMISSGETLWKSPTAVAAHNGNPPTSNYYQHRNGQPRLNRVNTEKEIKKSMIPNIPYSLGLAVENISNAYAKKETDQFLNHHQELNKKQTAAAAVSQHFENSFKQYNKPKKNNWISNLPVPQRGPKTPPPQDTFKQRPPTLPTTNKRIVEEWKEKNNKIYSPPVLTPIGTSFSRPLTQQANYRPQAVPKLNYDHESLLLNVNKNGSIHNVQMYSTYSPAAASSVIVRNESSHYRDPPTAAAQEAYGGANNGRTPPTILSVPAAVKTDGNPPEPKQAKNASASVHYVCRSAKTGPSKTHDPPPQEHLFPVPFELYPPYRPPRPQSDQSPPRPVDAPSVRRAGPDAASPPPAHLNAAANGALSKLVPFARAHHDDFQSEPLDLVVVACDPTAAAAAAAAAADRHLLRARAPLETCATPRRPHSGNRYGAPDSRETAAVANKCDYYVCHGAPPELPSDLETSLPDNTVSPPPPPPPIAVATNNVAATRGSSAAHSASTSNLTAAGRSPPIAVDSNAMTGSKNGPAVTRAASAKTDTLGQILSRASASGVSTETAPSTSTRNSSPSTPPPVLTPSPYIDVICGLKTHHHPKVKKAWLQRHEWAEDLKEAGVDQNPSNSARTNDAPPVLECEVTKKRKISKSASENSVHLKISSDLSLSDSDLEPRSSNDGTKKSKKRKVSNVTIPSENKSASTESDKDSDLAVEKKVPPIKIPKKRGRKPKVVVSIPFKKGKNNKDNRQLQSGPCLNVGPKIHKCRECRIFLNKKKKDVKTQDEIDNIFCRFYAFRRIFKNKSGLLVNAGFPDPYRDVTVEDLNLWMPNSKFPPVTLDVDVSKKVLLEAGRQLCYLVKEENKALNLSPFSKGKPIAWKKAANGVREMCDVCLTTIFNFHWACAKCGFGVCIDCVKARMNGTAEAPNAATMTKKDLRERDTFMWMTCNNKHNHDVERLMLTQIVAGESMNMVFESLHSVSTQWDIKLECGCPGHPFPKPPRDEVENNDDNDESHSKKLEDISNAAQSKDSSTESVEPHNTENPKVQKENVKPNHTKCDTLKHFIRKKNQYFRTIPRQLLPPRVMTLAESQELFPGNPHSWLCDGRLLRLLDPEDPTNCAMFQEQWKRGQPVMISDVGKRLNPDLWNPSSFCRDFGRYTNDLIDCATGLLIEGKTMKQFWDGFEEENKRLKDSDGNKMLLKLKDWPVAADFSETLPERFEDLMRALPLKDYTQREGKLNLASRLPSCFVRPDLGPKMYSAYGNAGYRDPGKQLLSTTNLHLDVSDAVNVMVFVSVTQSNGDKGNEPDQDWHIKEAYRAVDEAGCDMASRRRAREAKEYPGAVWHIYQASDADSIRDLLNKISAERGEPLEPNHDPIHDQSSYLDADLRARLYNEYGVQGYAVLQCLGDAIFIPAGAPHQVRNLHNCIKVAEDFVSPENLSQCFRLMNEFRDLSSNHINHEDKLQIKNIMYHAVKDSLSVLLHESEKKELK